MGDFFISYKSEDQTTAERIALALEEAGYSCLIQAWDFDLGTNFLGHMQRGLTEYDYTLAILTENYFKSNYTLAEWTNALMPHMEGEKPQLIPVRCQKIVKEGLLRAITGINLIGKDDNQAKTELLAKAEYLIRRGARARTNRPPQPAKPTAITFHVPHGRNPNFSGREDYLAALGQALAGGPAALTQAIAGLGGVGKTQLALEYCYLHRGDYALIWWVRCEEPATLASDFAGLAPHLGLPQHQDQTQTVAAVRQRLATLPSWLLVLDNVEKPEDLKDYLPQGGQGHVLITSREDMSDIASTMDVTVWPEEEAIAFILKRTGEKDQETAKALATELGRLPLALEQAGAYIKKTGCGVNGYLAMLKDNLPKLMQWGKGLSGYEKNVATTWLPAFEAVQKKSPAAAELLNLCAFLAPDDIPLEIIKEGKEFLPPALAGAVDNPLAWNEALAALKAYSLVQREGDSLSVHRLVQAVTRDRLGEEERKNWAGVAVLVVNMAFPGGVTTNVNSWPTCARLLAHGLASVEYAEKLAESWRATGRLLNQMAAYLWGRAELTQARILLERALEADLKLRGPDHPAVALRRNNLASVLHALGDLPAAREQMELALASDLKTHGPDHPAVAVRRNNQASVLQDLGDLPAAREQYELALAIFEKVLGADHPNVATLRNNLGTVLQDLGDLPAARKQFELALASDLKTYGPDHPAVANRRNNLGSVLRNLGDLTAAREQFEQSFAILERFLPPEHPDIIASLRNLAACHDALGNPGQAAELRARAAALQAQRQAKGLDG